MRPPQHAITTHPTYIRPDDPAWDQERLNDELLRSEDHPWRAYYEGRTRYDLDAPVRWKLFEHCKCEAEKCERCGSSGTIEHDRENTAREFLVDGGEADLYILRRPKTEHWSVAKSMWMAEGRKDGSDRNFYALSFYCARNGILRIVVGGEVTYDYSESRRPVPDDVMRGLVDASDQLNLAEEIGIAVWRASQDPTEVEKKA
jgi:hypothetical protein